MYLQNQVEDLRVDLDVSHEENKKLQSAHIKAMGKLKEKHAFKLAVEVHRYKKFEVFEVELEASVQANLVEITVIWLKSKAGKKNMLPRTSSCMTLGITMCHK